MYRIEIFLPLDDSEGRPLENRLFDAVRQELVDRFGGATFYSRSPAEGLWKGESDRVQVDRIVIVEVLAGELEYSWWTAFRRRMEKAFRQESVLIHASPVEVL